MINRMILIVLIGFLCQLNESFIVKNPAQSFRYVPLSSRVPFPQRIPLMSSITESPSTQSPIFTFKGLTSVMFAHPLDAQITKQLSQIPFLESVARNIYTVIEQAFVVENLGSSILVGPKQMPMLYKSLVTASKILDIPPPDLYVKQNPSPNAYTLAFMGRKPFIVVHTGLLDLMDEKEVMSVLGHELGHLKCEHGVWVTLLNLIIESVDFVVGPVAPLRSLLLRWQRSAEYSCDRAALLVSQDYRVVASVLMKLCGGSSKNEFSRDLNVDAFLEQAKILEVEKKSLPGKRTHN